MMTIDEIRDNFALLDDWDDRYRYVIELGRTLAPMPEAEHSADQQGARLRQPGLALQADRPQQRRRTSAELSRRQRRAYRARTDRDPADTLFRPHAARDSCHRRHRGVRRIRISRAPDAAALQRPARHGRAHSLRRARGSSPTRFPESSGHAPCAAKAISAAAAVGQAPFSWRAGNAPPHNSAPPSDSPPAGPICPGIVPASCCIACADGASAI